MKILYLKPTIRDDAALKNTIETILELVIIQIQYLITITILLQKSLQTKEVVVRYYVSIITQDKSLLLK